MDFNVIVGSFAIVKDNSPKYVVPTSNSHSAITITIRIQSQRITLPVLGSTTKGNDCCDVLDAYLLGVPCLVLKSPYKKERKDILGNIKVKTVIDVKSCVSGLKYTIPYDWVEEYHSLVEANEHAQIIGHHFPEVRELIGKPYWPRDNSFITGLHGETWTDLYHKKCEIVSVPFIDTVGNDDFETEYTFILVKHNGKYYRTLFEEWALY